MQTKSEKLNTTGPERESVGGVTHHFAVADAANLPLDDDSVDLILASPPYGSQRSYGIGMSFSDDAEWVQWAADRYMESLRVCRGLVAWVVEGYTRKGTFHPLPELLTAEIAKRGANIRRRIIFKRYGIMGGSPDELAQHHEIVVCASKMSGRLPYANPAATGHPPKCPPGGTPTHQSRDGRINRPRLHQAVGGSERRVIRQYKPPVRCKASNVIDCGAVGGGNMGSRLSAENEAPFPESLAEPIVLTYSPVGGIVCDPFSGSGTTVAVAVKNGRSGIGFDIRESQVELGFRRIAEIEGSGPIGFPVSLREASA